MMIAIAALGLMLGLGSYVIAGLVLDQRFGGSPETITKSFYRKWTNYMNGSRTAVDDSIYRHDERVLGSFAAELDNIDTDKDPFLCDYGKPLTLIVTETGRNTMTDRAEVTVTAEYSSGKKDIFVTTCAFEKKWRICGVRCK